MLKNKIVQQNYSKNSLEQAAISFIRERCKGLRFDKTKATTYDSENLDYDGTSLKKNQIPYNMEKDIDRLCLQRAVERFLESGKKEDAFDVYFCYLDMFVGDYEKTRRMIELLSEYEANGSGILMKHRDHYSHSVYVFILGLAIYETNEIYRDVYKDIYEIKEDNAAACHYLQYWGMTSLFHDIGYPFELPFEQVASYFEVDNDKREDMPFVSYHALDSFVQLNKSMQRKIARLYDLDTDKMIRSTDELFAYDLFNKLGKTYYFSESEMLDFLHKKPTEPNMFNHYMDHAYFSATVLFKKFFEELEINLKKEYVDSLTAIILHNSLYKFNVAYYKKRDNMPLEAKDHPLAYMLMLCDELQCWDRIAYGRNSKLELHPMDCRFDLGDNCIKATYIFDEGEKVKIDRFEKGEGTDELKAYSSYVPTKEIKRADGTKDKISSFQADIERIVDLTQIKLTVDKAIEPKTKIMHKSYLSDSNFIELFRFAIVLNGVWGNVKEWKAAKNNGRIEEFLLDKDRMKKLTEDFKGLSLEYKLSNLNQAKAFAGYLNEIGCFYTDKEVEFNLVEAFNKKELIKIGQLEHRRWLQEHYDMGWVYGTPDEKERDFLRQHKDMIPEKDENVYEISVDMAEENYDRLDKAEQDKDTDPMECMLAMIKLFDGLRIYRLR